jgi:PAS domain S-box-containing protein
MHADSQLVHLRRVEAVASAVRKQLLRVRTETEVFEHACSIAVMQGRFRFAWIGLADREGRLRPVARAGFEDGYLDETVIVGGLNAKADGPLARAFRSGVPCVADDIATDPSFAPYKDAAKRRGYDTVGAFPLRRGGAVVGALVIYATEANRFDGDHVSLFDGLAADIGFTLDVLDANAQRLRAEEARKQSEDRYRALVEQATETIFVASSQGILLEVNAAAAEMTGYTREELVGQDMTILFDPADPTPRTLLGHAAGTRLAAERRIRRKDGSIFLGEVTGSVLADGRIQGYARDVTARTTLQQKLIVRDRLASLGRLAAGVAHEINNPLAYVALNLERIAREVRVDSIGPEAVLAIRSAAADAIDGAERVRAVVKSLGAFSREDEGAVTFVDLHKVLDAAVRLSESRLRNRGQLEKDFRATRRVRGNELRLGQVFVNLLVNAADALPASARDKNRVRVSTMDDGDRVVVLVEDNGVGIPPEIIGRVFDPFFTTKDVGEGTGLGLSISHGIVSAFGGQVTVESQKDRGASFRVALLAESTEPREGA